MSTDYYLYCFSETKFPNLCNGDTCPTNSAEWIRAINIYAQLYFSSIYTDGKWECFGRLRLYFSCRLIGQVILITKK